MTGDPERIPDTFTKSNPRFYMIGKTVTIQFEPFQQTKPNDHSIIVTISFDSALGWLVLTYLISTVWEEISYT